MRLQTALVFMLVFSAPCAAQTQESPKQPQDREVTAIRAVLDAQEEAWSRGDIERFMLGYWKSSLTVFVGADGVRRGWQALLDRYRKAYPDRRAMGKLSFSALEITPLCPGVALVLGRFDLEPEHDHPHGFFTLVFRRFPEGWRIVSDHTSAAPR